MTTINGTSGADTINPTTYQYSYSIYGAGGNDRITVNAAYVNTLTIYAGTGNDIINFGAQTSATVHGEDGDDTITVLTSTSSSSRFIYGDDGNDIITGSSDVDYIYGGTGNDIIKGVAGADHLFGEDGNDTFLANSTSDFVYYDGGTGTDTIIVPSPQNGFFYTQLRFASLTSIEVIEDQNPTKDAFIFGNGLDLREITLKNIDGVEGESGNDNLKGGYSINSDYSERQMNLRGGSGDDIIKGVNAADKTIDGHSISFSGNEKIDGGAGNDDIYGLGGDDDITLGAGSDKIHFDASSGNDLVRDFIVGTDMIYMHMTSKTDISELSIYDSGNDLIVSLGGNYITLENLAGTHLDNSTFVFTETAIAY